MGSGLSVDADAETAYSFIACADACVRRDYTRLANQPTSYEENTFQYVYPDLLFYILKEEK